MKDIIKILTDHGVEVWEGYVVDVSTVESSVLTGKGFQHPIKTEAFIPLERFNRGNVLEFLGY